MQQLSRKQELIVKKIRSLYKRGVPLNISAVRESHSRLLLQVYACKPYWGWKQALMAAGIDYADINVYLAEFVMCRVCDKHFKQLGKHIRVMHHMSPMEYKTIYNVSELYSPAYVAKRRRPTTIVMPHWEPNWTPEYVLDRIYELNRMGEPLCASHIKKAEKSIYHWAKQYFKIWDVALRAVGIDPDKVRKAKRSKYWTKRTVKQAIGQQYALGNDVNSKAITDYDRSLALAARKLFGSYDRALRSIGLEPVKVRKGPVSSGKYLTKDAVVNAIIRRKLRDQPIYSYGVSHGEHKNLSLWNKARRLFGGWRAAVVAAGLNYDKLTPQRTKYLTADAVVSALKERRENGFPLTAIAVRRGDNKDGNLYTRGCRFFGNWASALQAADIDHASVFQHLSRYPTKDSILKEITRRYNAGKPLDYVGLRKGQYRDAALYERTLALFGTWSEVLSKANIQGVTFKHPGGKYRTKQAVIREIKHRNAGNLTLLASHVMRGAESDRSLYTKALKLFGGWAEAIIASGLDYHAIQKQSSQRRMR